MIREKIILGNYTYLVDFFNAMEYFNDEEHYEYFYFFKNQDFISDTIVDKDIYFISKSNFDNKKFTFPLPHGVSTGYSINCKEFNQNFNNEILGDVINKIYNQEGNEIKLLCDKVRIYLPMVNTALTSIIDIENYINDIKFHYFIDLFDNYTRKAETEFKYENNTYSEYIEFYFPSLNNLIYNKNVYIDEYNECYDNETLLNIDSKVPFYLLYYPYKIDKTINDDGTIEFKKIFNIKPNYIINQFYSSFNIILYPYTKLNENNIYIIDTDLNYNSNTFNINVSFNLNSIIRFPFLNEIKENLVKYYGVPCIISKFEFPTYYGIDIDLDKNDENYEIEKLKRSYLLFNGHIEDDYIDFIYNDENNDTIFDEDLNDIKTTGFFIEFAKDNLFTDIFYKQCMPLDLIIDNLIFPLNDLFDSWDDIPSLILYRVTYIDKVSFNKIVSNPVIITDEWYKYLLNQGKFKLKFNKIYKIVNNDMKVGNYDDNENPILFIDKINCSIVKDSKNENSVDIYKQNTPRIVYKPIFYKTTELQNITLINGVQQNIGINLNEYLSKVETFKIIIENTTYMEIGRNDIYIIFSINSAKINSKTGKYLLVNENDEYISYGNYTIS